MLQFYDSGVNCRHTFARCAIFPKFIGRNSGVFDAEQTFELAEIKTLDPDTGKRVGTGIYAMSLASEYLAAGVEEVHSYGQSVADLKNLEFEIRTGNHPDPANLYIGYYSVFGYSIYDNESRHHSIRTRWEPEHGAKCHFQIEVFLDDDAQVSRAARRNDRARITQGIIRGLVDRRPLSPHLKRGGEDQLLLVLPAIDELHKVAGEG